MKPFLALLLLILSTPLWANEKAVGFSLGNPTGVNGKYWLSEDTAIDGGMGFSIGKHTDFSLHSDYLLHQKGALVFNDVNPLDVYYGLGARMEFADDIEMGLRVPIGLAHRLQEQNFDVFSEIAPILDFIGKTGIELHILAGGRYYF